MGIGTILEEAMDTILDGYVSSTSASVCDAIGPIVITVITIYIILMGFSVVRGESDDPVTDVVWRFIRISFIAGIALSVGEYQTVIVDGVGAIEGAFIEALSGSASIGGVIDNVGEPFEALGNELWGNAVTGFWPNFTLLFAAAIIAIAQAALFIIGLGMYVLAKVALALSLAVGPVFLFMAMFPATQKYTENWLGLLLNYTMLKVLVAASITMLTIFAEQFATHLVETDGENALSSALALLISVGALIVVLLNLPTIAAALTGGASLSGIGSAVARFVVRGRNPSPPKTSGNDSGGGEIRYSGNSSRGGRNPIIPLYQANVQDGMRRAQRARGLS